MMFGKLLVIHVCYVMSIFCFNFLSLVHTQPPSELYSLHPQVPPPPPPQSAPQDIIRPHFHPPYPPMLHPPPPPPHQIMPHSAPDFMRPPRPTGSGFIPRSQVPRPPMLHPPGLGPHHASNNYY